MLSTRNESMAHFAEAKFVPPCALCETPRPRQLNSLSRPQTPDDEPCSVSEKNRLRTAIRAVRPRIEAHIDAGWSRRWTTSTKP